MKSATTTEERAWQLYCASMGRDWQLSAAAAFDLARLFEAYTASQGPSKAKARVKGRPTEGKGKVKALRK